ncbi:MAG: LON peptidase substrate-binding domain-containing protein [Elsteraceae bacterium]
MTGNPFDPAFEELPATIPVFPLTGVLLLPRGKLPLNIFEPRYLNMTLDAMGTACRMIGMVQPTDSESRGKNPELYRVGCAGRITSFNESEDGRLLVTLSGICRFKIAEELELHRGYRQVKADWSAFADDLIEEPSVSIDRARLLQGLRDFFKMQGITANWDAIEQSPDERLVTSLAMVCPFAPIEKQALLEASGTADRAAQMIAMIEMAVLGQAGDGEMARH